MPTTLKRAKRIFTINDDEKLSDPNPSLSAEEVQDLLSINNPELATAKLIGPEINEKGELIYDFQTTVGEKG